MSNFVQTQVLVVGATDEPHTFNGCGENMRAALQAAKKQARAFVRRKGLSVRQPNCTHIPPDENDHNLFVYEFVDYEVDNLP